MKTMEEQRDSYRLSFGIMWIVLVVGISLIKDMEIGYKLILSAMFGLILEVVCADIQLKIRSDIE
jgi:hypothetical protein